MQDGDYQNIETEGKKIVLNRVGEALTMKKRNFLHDQRLVNSFTRIVNYPNIVII